VIASDPEPERHVAAADRADVMRRANDRDPDREGEDQHAEGEDRMRDPAAARLAAARGGGERGILRLGERISMGGIQQSPLHPTGGEGWVRGAPSLVHRWLVIRCTPCRI
jgi:hypothetical protein